MRLALALLFASTAACGQTLFDGVPPAPDLSQYPTISQLPTLSPVQSVNGAIGAVVVTPGPQIQRTTTPIPVSTTDGTATWTFPKPFVNQPSCYLSLSATTTAYTYDAPLVTAISTTSVSVAVTAHPKSYSIASLSLPIILQFTAAGAPTGTTISFSCIAPSS